MEKDRDGYDAISGLRERLATLEEKARAAERQATWTITAALAAFGAAVKAIIDYWAGK